MDGNKAGETSASLRFFCSFVKKILHLPMEHVGLPALRGGTAEGLGPLVQKVEVCEGEASSQGIW